MAGGTRFLPTVHHRVLLVLVLAAVPAVWAWGFVSIAPNRLVSGSGVPLTTLAHEGRWALGVPFAVLLLAVFAPPLRWVYGAVAFAAALLLAGLCALAGGEAARQSALLPSLARVSLGGGFWVLVVLAWLIAADALRRLNLSPVGHVLAHVAVLLPAAVLMFTRQLDQLSLVQEYANRREAFDAAGARHLQIVAAALLPALAVGLPLGVAAARHPAFGRPLMAVLNVIQTVPSIALFALLIVPVGIGLLPAAIALALYALLPIVHGTTSGLAQVPAAAIEAGTGMGMTARQLFWRVRVPLALPVLLSGLRVTTVQLIGLAVVAALIGAGGFGALVFQGITSSALDLVLLGVLPVVALAVLADAGFGVLAALMQRPAQ